MNPEFKINSNHFKKIETQYQNIRQSTSTPPDFPSDEDSYKYYNAILAVEKNLGRQINIHDPSDQKRLIIESLANTRPADWSDTPPVEGPMAADIYNTAWYAHASRHNAFKGRYNYEDVQQWFNLAMKPLEWTRFAPAAYVATEGPKYVYFKKYDLTDLEKLEALVPGYLDKRNNVEFSEMFSYQDVAGKQTQVSNKLDVHKNKINAEEAKKLLEEIKHQSQGKTLNTHQKKQVGSFLASQGVNPATVSDKEQCIINALMERRQEAVFDLRRHREAVGLYQAKRFIVTTHNVGQALSQLGIETHNKGLARIGEVTQLSMRTADSLTQVGTTLGLNMGSALGEFGLAMSSVTNMLGSVLPVVGLVSDIIKIGRSIFSRRKKSGGDNGLALAIKGIFDYLQRLETHLIEIRKDIHELRNEVYELRNEVYEFRIENYNKQLEIIDTILRQSSAILTGLNVIVLTIEANQLDSLSADFINIRLQLEAELIPEARATLQSISNWLNVKAVGPAFNSEVVYTSAISNPITYHQTINQRLTPEKASDSFGLLYAVYKHECKEAGIAIPAEVQNLEKFMPNLGLWLYAFETYIEYSADPRLQSRLNHLSLENIKKIPLKWKNFIDHLKQDGKLLEHLNKKYQETLQALGHISNNQLASFDAQKLNALTLPGMFQDAGANKATFESLVAQAEYYKNLILIFSFIPGDYLNVAKHQHLINSQHLIDQYSPFSPSQIKGPEWMGDLRGKPAYYETLQFGKFKHNEVEKIYTAIRNKNGIDLRIYNPNDNTWHTAPNNPAWTDAAGMDVCCYYQTLRSAVIGSKIYFTMRIKSGFTLYAYDVNNNEWNQLASTDQVTTSYFTDAQNWNSEAHSLPTSLIIVNQKSLLLRARYDGGLVNMLYEPAVNKWTIASTFVNFGNNWGAKWNNRPAYSTMKSITLLNDLGNSIFIARYYDGRPFLYLSSAPQLSSRQERLIDENFYKASRYLPTETEIISIAGKDHFFMTDRTAAGLKVYRTWDLVELAKRGSSNEIFSASSDNNLNFDDRNGFGEAKHAHAASIRTEVVKINGKDKLLVMGQSKDEFIIYAMDPETMKWQKLGAHQLFKKNFDGVSGITLRTEFVTLADGTQELIVASMHRDGLKLLRHPMSIRPLIQYLSQPAPGFSENPLVPSREKISPLEPEINAILDQITAVQTMLLYSGNQATDNSAAFGRDPAENPTQSEVPAQCTSSSWPLPGVCPQIIGERAESLPHSASSSSTSYFTSSYGAIFEDYLQSSSTQLVFLQWFINTWVNPYLPSNQMRKLTSADLKMLQDFDESFSKLLCRYYKLDKNGLDQEILQWVQNTINKLGEVISNLLDPKQDLKVTTTSLNEIRSKLDRVDEQLTKLAACSAKDNNALAAGDFCSTVPTVQTSYLPNWNMLAGIKPQAQLQEQQQPNTTSKALYK